MSETRVGAASVIEARLRLSAPQMEHGRLLQERAEELGRQYSDLEMQLYDVRRALLYIMPDLEKYRRFLDEEITFVKRLQEEQEVAAEREKYAERYRRRTAAASPVPDPQEKPDHE